MDPTRAHSLAGSLTGYYFLVYLPRLHSDESSLMGQVPCMLPDLCRRHSAGCYLAGTGKSPTHDILPVNMPTHEVH